MSEYKCDPQDPECDIDEEDDCDCGVDIPSVTDIF